MSVVIMKNTSDVNEIPADKIAFSEQAVNIK